MLSIPYDLDHVHGQEMILTTPAVKLAGNHVDIYRGGNERGERKREERDGDNIRCSCSSISPEPEPLLSWRTEGEPASTSASVPGFDCGTSAAIVRHL